MSSFILCKLAECPKNYELPKNDDLFYIFFIKTEVNFGTFTFTLQYSTSNLPSNKEDISKGKMIIRIIKNE